MSYQAVDCGDVCKVVIEWTLPNDVIANNVLYYYRSDTGNPPVQFSDFMDLAVTKVEALGTTILTHVSDLVDIPRVTGYTVAYAGGVWGTEGLMGQKDVTITFTQAGEALPHGVAGLITYPTLYPRVRARSYIPGLTEADCVDGVWHANLIAVLEDWGDEHLDGITGAGSDTYAACVPRNNGVVALLVSRKVSTYPAYQRRRRP